MTISSNLRRLVLTLLLTPMAIAANADRLVAPISFSMGGVCARWWVEQKSNDGRWMPIPDESYLGRREGKKCEDLGNKYAGDCNLDLTEGDYRLRMSAVAPGWEFSVKLDRGTSEPDHYTVEPRRANDHVTLNGGVEHLSVNSRILRVARDGYLGAIFFEHQYDGRSNPNSACANNITHQPGRYTEFRVPVGALINLSFNWMGLHQSRRTELGQFPARVWITAFGAPVPFNDGWSDRRFIYRPQIDDEFHPWLRLYPVDVDVTPPTLPNGKKLVWTIISGFRQAGFDFSQIVQGPKTVRLLPGMNFGLAAWEKGNSTNGAVGYFAFNYRSCNFIKMFDGEKPLLEAFEMRANGTTESGICRQTATDSAALSQPTPTPKTDPFLEFLEFGPCGGIRPPVADPQEEDCGTWPGMGIPEP